jgi:hypothetical protein
MRGLGLCLVAAAAATLVGAASAGAQQRVGIDSAVNPQATATPPGGTARRVTIGEPVLFNERFATSAEGQTQILFLDQSAMTIGPNSDVTIDEFAYNPSTGTGRLAMTTTRGVLRFVGGKLSKQENAVTLRTPSATLAVRGGAFLANQTPAGHLDVHFVYGIGLSVTGTDGITEELRRPGFSITVSGPGAAPSAPFPTPIGALSRLLAALNGRAGSSGGAANPPTQGGVAGSGIGNVISGDLVASFQAAGETQLMLIPPSQVNTANLDIGTVQAQGTPGIAVAESGQSSSTNTTAPRTFYPLAAFAEVDTTKAFTGGGGILRNGNFNNGAFAVEPGTAVLQNGVLSAAASNAAVSFPLAPGFSTFGPQGTSSTFGAITGSGYLAPDDAFFFAEGTTPSQPNKIGVIAGGFPTINLPTTGIGSYAGSMSGLVNNGGSIYLANGSFTNVYNFATGTGNFSISNFDGKSLSGSVASISSSISRQSQAQAAALGAVIPANIGNLVYFGKVSGSGLSGGVGGAFFGNNASDTGGGFGFKSPSGAYKAGGLFGGNR